MTIALTTLEVAEGGTASYTVRPDFQPQLGDVTVTPKNPDESAVTISPATLTFDSTNWNTEQRVTVTGVEDQDTDHEFLTVENRGDHDAGRLGTRRTIPNDDLNLVLVDNDATGTTAGSTVTPTSLVLNEGDLGTYTITLTSTRTGTATMTVTNPNPGAATVFPLTHAFPAGDVLAPVILTVFALQDRDADHERFTITNAVSGYGSVTELASVSIVILDDEIPPPSLVSVSASGGTARADRT